MDTIPTTLAWTSRILESPLTHALAGAGVLLLDFFTSKYLLFPILFVLPVALAAWFCRPFWAYFLAATLPVGRFFVAVHLEVPSPPIYLATNGVTRIVVLALLAFLIARTSRQTKELKRRVSGLVTMCAWSRTVEFEGEWISFEKYLKRRFGLDTSHGISPEELEKTLGAKGLVADPAALASSSPPRARPAAIGRV